MFFASESGAEAAFFHHNSRGAGLNFLDGTDASQTLTHSSVNAETNWTIEGRSNQSDGASPVLGNATVMDILKEGQTLKIPLQWDPSANPSVAPPTTTTDYGRTDNSFSEFISFQFYPDPSDFPNSTAKDAFEAKYNFDSNAYPIPSGFDFGESGNNAVLIDWSVTRKNSSQGVQTFIPITNQDCSTPNSPGYICENSINNGSETLQIRTNDTISGKVLPGSIDVDLSEFWACVRDDLTTFSGDVCTDYQVTIRPLLKFTDTISGDKIPGIPYRLTLNNTGAPKTFPQSSYNVVSDVVQENFSQRIEIEVPEKTSIGAFDYVIFD